MPFVPGLDEVVCDLRKGPVGKFINFAMADYVRPGAKKEYYSKVYMELKPKQ